MVDVIVVNAVAVTEAAAGPALMWGDVFEVDGSWWVSVAGDGDLNGDVSAPAICGASDDELSLLYRSA